MLGLLGAIWGIGGVCLLLGYAIVRLTPIIIDTFSYELGRDHWAVLGLNLVVMIYFEGYRGFQKNFSPRVAARAKYIAEHPNLLYSLLAPFYCLGYFHTSRKRKIVVYSLTIGIILLILLVHRLEQPWRGAIDVGVVVGLSWGLVTLVIYGIQAFTSAEFSHSPEIPEAILD